MLHLWPEYPNGSVFGLFLFLVYVTDIADELNCVTRKKEGNVLFNDALNTFYLWLYGVRHIVKNHSDSERKPAAATWATLSD